MMQYLVTIKKNGEEDLYELIWSDLQKVLSKKKTTTTTKGHMYSNNFCARKRNNKTYIYLFNCPKRNSG